MALETLIANFGMSNLVALMAMVVIGLPHDCLDGLPNAPHMSARMYAAKIKSEANEWRCLRK